MDEVGGVALRQPGTQSSGPEQGPDDLELAPVALVPEVVEQAGGRKVGGRCADEDPVDIVGPLIDRRGEAGKSVEQPGRVRLAEQCGHVRSVLDRQRLVVAPDGGVVVNSRYTVATGTSDSVLMASMVVRA
jgi:hypothetical protein